MITLFFYSLLAGFFATFSLAGLPLFLFTSTASAITIRRFNTLWVLGFATPLFFKLLKLYPLFTTPAASMPNWVVIGCLFWLLIFSSSILLAPFLFKDKTICTPLTSSALVVTAASCALLWEPWEGPVFQVITMLVTLQAKSATSIFMLFFYTLGASLPFLVFILLLKGIGRFAPLLQSLLKSLFALLTLLTASLMLYYDFSIANLDRHPPRQLQKLERGRILQRRLSQLVDNVTGGAYSLRLSYSPSDEKHKNSTLPTLGPAPTLEPKGPWLNVSDTSIVSLNKQPVFLHFWNHGCLSCLRSQKQLHRWHEIYAPLGLQIISIHSPEYRFEASVENVSEAVRRMNITYPVLLDNDKQLWESFGNLYWPTSYLIDGDGRVRYLHFGGGDYLRAENAIRQLLHLPPLKGLVEQRPRCAISPAIYMGYERGTSYPPDCELYVDQRAHYPIENRPATDQIVLQGSWCIEEEAALACGDESWVEVNFLANRVYALFSGASGEPLKIFIDGKPQNRQEYTEEYDQEGNLYIDEARSYHLLNLPGPYGRHTLRMHVPKGLKLYSLSFGAERSSIRGQK